MAVKFKPDAYGTVTPYLMVADGPKQLDFLSKVFGAVEIERVTMPDGTVAHAEVRVGDSVIMMGQTGGEWKPIPSSLYVYVKDVDATYDAALKEGGTSIHPPADQFYGDRSAGVKDPLGISWWIATHIEDLTLEELQRRALACAGKK